MYDDNDNILAIEFLNGSTAYEALSKLKQLDAQGQIHLTEGAVAVRGEDGTVDIKDDVNDARFAGTAGGGMIGLLVGVLGGPFGVLIGGTTGLLVGSLFDLYDQDASDSALSRISSAVGPGQTVVLAQVTEPTNDVIDTAMGELGGTVQRYRLDDVQAEIAAADLAQRRAKREARKALVEERRAQLSDRGHAKIEELKSKLHPATA